MIRGALLFVYLLLHLCCFSQTAKQSLIPSYIKTGAYSNKNSDAFSFSSNQATLARIKAFSAGVFGERKFMLDELNLFSAAFALPTQSGNFGLQLHQFGNSNYGEMQTGLAYARKLGDFVDLGIQFNYYNIRIAGYGNASTLNFDAGVIFHFTDQLHGGLHIYNPTSSKLGKNNEERLPAVFNVGLGYDASENFFVSSEIEKVEDQPINVNVNLQYKFAERVLVRGGVATNTAVFFFGAGFIVKNFRFDATASLHPQLGVTPGLLLIYAKQVKE